MADNVKEKTQEVMSTVRDKSEQALEEVKITYDKASDIVAEQSAVVADFVRGFVFPSQTFPRNLLYLILV